MPDVSMDFSRYRMEKHCGAAHISTAESKKIPDKGTWLAGASSAFAYLALQKSLKKM
jgi:hypothetical protein